MKRSFLIVFAALSVGGLAAESVLAVETEFLPPAHELFKPLMAAPRELQFALRLVIPVGQRLLGEAAMGDYLGIYRWTLASGTKIQISGGGGAFGRYDLAGTTNDTETVDFFGNVPVDIQKGPWSNRFMLYHTSSHFGDDYIRKHNVPLVKHSWDNLRYVGSYEASRFIRLYAGYNYIFRTLPGHINRHAVQGGIEWRSPWQRNHLQFYWANDLQAWGRSAWNPMIHSQAGITFANNAEAARTLDLFLEFADGPQPQGQWYQQHETNWALGLRFRLG